MSKSELSWNQIVRELVYVGDALEQIFYRLRDRRDNESADQVWKQALAADQIAQRIALTLFCEGRRFRDLVTQYFEMFGGRDLAAQLGGLSDEAFEDWVHRCLADLPR